MIGYSIEPRARKQAKGFNFVLLRKNLSDKYGNKFLDTARKTRIDPAKTPSKKQFIKQLKQQVKAKPVPDQNSINAEEIVIPPEKRVINK